MIISYPAIFVEEKVGGFSVIFPDLNHLATCGDDLEEATFMAVDCLAGYIYSEKIDGNKIPPPTPIEKIDPKTEDLDAENNPEIVRIFLKNISVDVDAYAKKNFINHEEDEEKIFLYA